MPSNWNALFIAWAISLIIVIGGGLTFEFTYTPPAPAGTPPSNAVQPQQEQPSEEVGHTETIPTYTADNKQDDVSERSGEQDTGMADDETDTPPTVAQQDPTTGLTVPATDTGMDAPQIAIGGPLPVEADPALLETTNQGPLPRISDDGRKSYQVYAAPGPREAERPRIALVVTDMGMMARNTRRAIAELPPEVTFAFSPYAPNLIEWGEEARRTGHEVLLMIPMEPQNYPQNDPGPLSLLTSYSTRENVNMLKASLGTLTGYVGVINHMGSRFTAAADSLRPILDELNNRGLLVVDSRASQFSRTVNMARAIGLPSAYNNRYVDDNLAQDVITAELQELEKQARATGAAVGVAHNYPVTIKAVENWAAGLEARGFVLVPITSVTDRQPAPR
ncbi:divergent polysaccharide deacetylase family protein [Kordiimonas aestuarii]|uniref:divergent polysaccharide deacetylase family protein n=1 Tax=Kordiimonas aestuarii TaxID=1005925 RepID=UPI0021CEE017|nr:divergent polysaccharide deacetylase family protein [Kordiimonas aestuarii]